MDRETVTKILQIASDVDARGFGSVATELAGNRVLGKMFHGAAHRDKSICDLAATRLGIKSVDLSWTDVETTESITLLDEVRMASEAVDLLVTVFSSYETFGDGRRLTKKFPESSVVPVISLHDDFYDWQSALSHIHGFQKALGDLQKKQIVIAWGFGTSFNSPAMAHSLMITSALLGANVRVVAPSEFSLLNRVRSRTEEIITDHKSSFEETTEFDNAFKDADAVFSLNWLRLNDFNHPERNMQHASKYREWYMTPDLLPKHCIFSTEHPFQPDLMLSPELVQDQRNISHASLNRRVHLLAATIVHVLRESKNHKTISVI